MTTKTHYFPAPIRGLTYPGHIRVNRSQLRRYLENENLFRGFIVGSNVNTYHFFGGWRLACKLECGPDEFFERLQSFEWYLDKELGNRAAIYLKNDGWRFERIYSCGNVLFTATKGLALQTRISATSWQELNTKLNEQ